MALFLIGQGFPSSKPGFGHFPPLLYTTPRATCVSSGGGYEGVGSMSKLHVFCQPPKTKGCHACVPDALALLVWLGEVKQMHYYGIEPSSVSGGWDLLGQREEAKPRCGGVGDS